MRWDYKKLRLKHKLENKISLSAFMNRLSRWRELEDALTEENRWHWWDRRDIWYWYKSYREENNKLWIKYETFMSRISRWVKKEEAIKIKKMKSWPKKKNL